MKRVMSLAAIAVLMTGCGSVNNALVEKQKTVEYYRIFDLKTKSDREAVADAASNGLGANISNAEESSPIPSFATPPEQPARFKLVNPFAGTAMAAFVGNMKTATCDDAVWTAKATRDVAGSNNLKITACLFQYKDGYHLDVYGVFNKTVGGLMQIVRSGASAMVGTPEEWTEKTFLDIVRNIRKVTGAEVTLLEASPKMSGTPWLEADTSTVAKK